MTPNPLCNTPSHPIVPTLTIAGQCVRGTYTKGATYDGKYPSSPSYMRWIFDSFPFSVMITAFSDKINVVYREPTLGHFDYEACSDLQQVADDITRKLDLYAANMRDWMTRVEQKPVSGTTPDQRAREFLKRIRDEAAGMGLNIFAVVGGPAYSGCSIYHNCGSERSNNAVWSARIHHNGWERDHGFDPDHDWEKDE